MQSFDGNPREQGIKPCGILSTDDGLFIIGVIAFTLGMMIWFYRLFAPKEKESQRQQG